MLQAGKRDKKPGGLLLGTGSQPAWPLTYPKHHPLQTHPPPPKKEKLRVGYEGREAGILGLGDYIYIYFFFIFLIFLIHGRENRSGLGKVEFHKKNATLDAPFRFFSKCHNSPARSALNELKREKKNVHKEFARCIF